MCALIPNKILENIFSQEKCFVFKRNYFSKMKSFYHVLIKHNTFGATYYDRLLDRREQAYAWCEYREGSSQQEHNIPVQCTLLQCSKHHKNTHKKGKTLHTLRILQVNVCIPHRLTESLIIIIFSIYCLALLNESLEHIIGNETMKSKANPLRCVVQY